MWGRLCVLYTLFTVVTGIFFNTPGTVTVGQSFSVGWTTSNSDPNNIPLYFVDDTASTIQQFTTIQAKNPSSGSVPATIFGLPGSYRVVAFFSTKQPKYGDGPDASSSTINVVAPVIPKITQQSPPPFSSPPSTSTQDSSSTSTALSTQNSPSSSSGDSGTSLSSSIPLSSSSSQNSDPNANTTTSNNSPSTTGTILGTISGTTATTASVSSSSSIPSLSQSTKQGGDDSRDTPVAGQTGPPSSNPTDASPSSSPPSSPNSGPGAGSGAISDSSSSNKTVIIGAVVGTLLGLLLIIGLIIFVHRVRRRRQREVTFFRERMVRNEIPPRPSTESNNDDSLLEPEKLDSDFL